MKIHHRDRRVLVECLHPKRCLHFRKQGALNKYLDEDKWNFKNPVDLPASTLKLAFDTDTKLEDIVKSLEKCSRDKPVPVFRRGKNGKVLEADQATNWKFEVIEYLSAEARIAEMAAAAEAAKIVHRD